MYGDRQREPVEASMSVELKDWLEGFALGFLCFYQESSVYSETKEFAEN